MTYIFWLLMRIHNGSLVQRLIVHCRLKRHLVAIKNCLLQVNICQCFAGHVVAIFVPTLIEMEAVG